MRSCTCVKCGWVSMAVTKAFAEHEVAKFNEYFDTLSPIKQQDYYRGRRSSLEDYTCQVCRGTEFRDYKEGDCPDGCTISAVVCEDIANG